MCGICGFMNFGENEPASRVILEQMVDMLAHRGPDSSGFYSDSVGGSDKVSVNLGHSRLSIIDLTDSARQPISNENGSIQLVCNGEIYNFPPLRKELQKAGHRFCSNTDIEVVVHAYERYGDQVPKHLDGMFSFALWDRRNQKLLLARDRTGKKPLYYSFDNGHFAFASEIKSLRVCPWIRDGISTARIPEYLTYGFVCAPYTLYEGIYQLPPASYLVIEQGVLKGPFKYWQLQFPDDGQELCQNEQEISVRLRELLTQAVEKRLISDVPLGALLSGGLDSSIVVGIISKILDRPVRTFSIGFKEDASFDESRYAADVARHFNTQHTEFMVRMDAVSLMEKLLWHYDQPYGDSAAIPTYLVSQLARQYVTVALNGDGGDEVFGGYDRFRAALVSAQIPSPLMGIGAAFVRMLPRRYGYYSLKRRLERFFNSDNGNTPLGRYLGWMSIFNKEMLGELMGREMETAGFYTQYLDSSKNMSLLHRILHLNFATYLPDDLNLKMDRMSMANALETRSPFLDTDVIEYAAKLHQKFKIRGNKTKYILRSAFEDLLPGHICQRPKHGFGMPLGIWFRNELGERFKDLLLLEDARSKAYFDQPVMERLYRQHQSGQFDHGYRLWTLLQFELWLRMLEKDRLWKPGMEEAVTDVVELKAG